jgi:hypothetical protein
VYVTFALIDPREMLLENLDGRHATGSDVGGDVDE